MAAISMHSPCSHYMLLLKTSLFQRKALSAVKQGFSRIEAHSTKACTQPLRHADHLDSKFHKTTMGVVQGFWNIGEANGMFTGVVRALAKKTGLVHQTVAKFRYSNITGNAEGRGYDWPQLIPSIPSTCSSCNLHITLEATSLQQ